jgi:3-deoxy-D-manno-octulosonic-acid transferase
MFLLYSLLFTLGVIVAAPYYLWRLRGNILRGAGWRERAGFLPAELRQESSGAIWVHAVSVGETLAAAGLVRELMARHPERKVFLSHVTPAGRETGLRRLPEAAGRFFLPLDWRCAVRRAFRAIRPELLVIVETELWPNLLRAARDARARVVIVNARLSDRSFHRYRLVAPFMRRVLATVDRIGARSEEDADRFRKLGAPPDRVTVTGNLKFDARPPEAGELVESLSNALAAAGRAPVIVAGSTMPGEEILLLPVWHEIRREFPRALWILAPRHPARFEAVESLLVQHSLLHVRRTALAADAAAAAARLRDAQVLLLDTVGELAGVYRLADVAFIGGTLVPTGGHNPLEAAYWKKPVVFGPHMQNFREIAEPLLAGGGAMEVRSAEEWARAVCELLRDAERRRRMGGAAAEVLRRRAGATERTLALLDECLKPRAAARTPA